MYFRHLAGSRYWLPSRPTCLVANHLALVHPSTRAGQVAGNFPYAGSMIDDGVSRSGMDRSGNPASVEEEGGVLPGYRP